MAKNSGRLARRYARALLGAANRQLLGEQGMLELAEALLAFAEIWQREKQLSSAMLNPMFPRKARLEALEELARLAALPEIAQSFLRVIFERERIAALPEIALAFSREADRALGIVRVSVVVAREVDAEEKESVERSLSESITGSPRFSWSVDPEIIGGMVIRYSGTVVDGSLRGRLDRIEEKLVKN